MSRDEARFWDRISKGYDRNDKADETYLKMLDIMRGYLNKDDTLMDLGCATGSISIDLSGSVRKVVGIDISPEMVRLAKEKAKTHRVENVYFARSTIFDERYEPGTYDSVMAFNVLHLLDDPGNAIKRINDLLKENGIFISNTVCLGEKGRLIGGLMTIVSKIGLMPKVNKFSVSELKEMIERNGFKIIESMTFEDRHHPFIIAKKMG